MRRWSEQYAEELVLDRLGGGEVYARDPGGGAQSKPDLMLRLRGGRTVAVEVTRHNIEADLAQRARMSKLDWRSADLNGTWELSMRRGFDEAALHRSVGQLLVTVERAGLEHFESWSPPPEDEHVAASVDGLVNLGVRYAHRLPVMGSKDGIVTVKRAASTGVAAGSDLLGVATLHASKEDNARKLQHADADERHLLIWIEGSQGQALTALLGDVHPRTPPDVPAHVDAVWLVSATAPAVILRWHRQDGWNELASWSPPPHP